MQKNMHKSAHIAQVNGVETSTIEISDRGLAYGDGLFETMRVSRGIIPLYDYHKQRLARGIEVLGLGPSTPMLDQFDAEVNSVLARASDDAIVKVIVTRGCGGRGYPSPEVTTVQMITQLFDAYPASHSLSSGATVELGEYRLGVNPALAGIKHLNRLDQVMAATELQQRNQGQARLIDELMLLSIEDKVIEGTKSNLLFFMPDKVVTPRLDRCGIEGTLRAALFDKQSEHGVVFEELGLELNDLKRCRAAALVNSVAGIRPIVRLQGQSLSIDARCEHLQDFIGQQFGYPN